MSKLILILIFLIGSQISYASFPILKVNDSTSETTNPMEPMLASKQLIIAGEMGRNVLIKRTSFFQRLKSKLDNIYFKKPPEGTDKAEFNWPAFALGLLFGPFGFLLAIVASKKDVVRRSAWLGFRVWMVAVGLIILVLLAKASK